MMSGRRSPVAMASVMAAGITLLPSLAAFGARIVHYDGIVNGTERSAFGLAVRYRHRQPVALVGYHAAPVSLDCKSGSITRRLDWSAVPGTSVTFNRRLQGYFRGVAQV